MAINHLKSYILCIVAGIGMLAVASCGGGKEPEALKYTMGTVQKVDKAVFEGGDLQKILINNEKKLAYVLNSKGAVFSVSLENGVKDFLNKKNWKKLTLKDESKDNTAGKAKLDQVEPTPSLDRQIYLTRNGVLVRTNLESAPATKDIGAVAYFEGNAVLPTYAWTNQAAHVAGAALANDRTWLQGIVVSKDGKERFLVFNNVGDMSSVELGPNQFTGKHTLAAGFGTIPRMAANAETIFLASRVGVSFLEVKDLGADKVLDPVVADASSAKWQMDPGTNNDDVAEVSLHDGRLYIALDAVGADTGGIAVYDIQAKTTTGPGKHKLIWDNVRASSLVEYKSKVRAIRNEILVEIKADGSLGEEAVSLDAIVNSKFKSRLLQDKASEGKTFYQGNIAELGFRDLSTVVPAGDDLILKLNTGSTYVITYEQKTYQRKAQDKKEQE